MHYGITLGSNLGDRRAHLKRALDLITERLADALPTRIGAMYETAPVGCPEGSPPFYNSFVEIESSEEPLAALEKLRAIEAELGRPNQHERNAPRTIDLDIIYADDVVMDHPHLILPHPRAAQRRFVMQQIALCHPDLVLPLQTQTARALLEELPDDGSEMIQISDEWAWEET